MPNIKIHWKGSPHHRLPRIRVPSTPRNSVRTRSQLAAEQVLRLPLGSSLEQARKKQRFNFRLRRRRGRSSRSTGRSAVVRSRRHASQRARQHIQVFGWGASQAELASRRTFETASIRPQSSRSVGTTPGFRNQQPQDSVIPSTDGAASSLARRAKACTREPEKLYSLMDVAEAPVSWKSRNIENQKRSSLGPDRSSIHSARRPGAEYAHVSPIETVSRRNTSGASGSLDKRGTYDCRIDPKNRLESRGKSGPSQIRRSTTGVRNIQTLAGKKHLSSAFVELREVVNSLGLQTKPEVASSNNTIDPSSPGTIVSEVASRSRSERKALRKFTREIELYLQACRSLPKGTLVATPSLTTISARTIDELKPYQAQFQSAGLAVTSNQQRRLSKPQTGESPPPTLPKDEKWSNLELLSDGTMGLRKDKQKEKRREPSYASGSTGTTVMGWTPPHEKSSPRPKTTRQPSWDSDHTVIGFTPPHEKAPVRPPPSGPKVPSKKSLPWLRKQESSPESVSPTNRMSAAPNVDESQPPIPLEGWVATSDSPTQDKAVEKLRKSGPAVPARPISKPFTNEKPAIDQAKTPTQQAMSIKISKVEADVIDTSLATTYADMATQTGIHAEASEQKPEESMANIDNVERAPIISGRNKTFPLIKKQCKDDYRAASEPIVTSSVPKPRGKSRVKWEGVDCFIQTVDVEPARPQPEDDNQNLAKSTSSPQAHSPKLCLRCVDELKPVTPNPEPKPQPEANSRPSSRLVLCHTCISCSSLICQQCFPSGQACPTISPLHNCPWDVADQESRRPAKDTVRAEPVTNSKEPADPLAIDQTEEELVKSDEPSEERFMPIQVIEEKEVEDTDQPLMPDPVKRLSLPRLKLKPPTISQYSPQRAQYSTTSRSKSLPQVPQSAMIVNFPLRLPDRPSNSSFSTLGLNPGKITDKQVFKGLHVVTAAACDEDVDKWIEEITGSGVRKFLADLSRFEGLGVNSLADVARRAAKQRKEKIRAWEVVREANAAGKEKPFVDGQERCKEEGNVNWVVGELGVVASDGIEEELECRVVHSRDYKRSENGTRDECCECCE